MKNKTKLVLILGIFAMFASSASAATAQNDTTVNVTVATESAVDLDPTYLNYSDGGLTPGSSQVSDDSGVRALQIENVGSENITDVWMEATEPTNNPFGTGDASSYDAANFVQIQLNNSVITSEFNDLDGSLANYRDEPVFINRRDYAERRDLSYIFVPDEANWEYGRFRAGEEEYFWAVENTSTADGATFRVGQTAHTSTQTGTTDFTQTGSSPEIEQYSLSATNTLPANFGKADITVPRQDGSTKSVTVIVQTDDSQPGGVYTVRSRFNTQYDNGGTVEDLSGQTNSELLFNSANGIDLAPGDSFQVGTQVTVPRGVPSEPVNTGTVTVNVRTN